MVIARLDPSTACWHRLVLITSPVCLVLIVSRSIIGAVEVSRVSSENTDDVAANVFSPSSSGIGGPYHRSFRTLKRSNGIT